MKNIFLWIAVLIFLLGCSSENVEQVTTTITGKAIAKQGEAEGPFSGQTLELTFGKAYKQSTFNPEGKVLQIKFERTYLPMKVGDKVIIRNRDAGREVVHIGKLGKKKEYNQQVFEREIQGNEEFAFIFKYPGNYQVLCKINGCLARIEVT